MRVLTIDDPALKDLPDLASAGDVPSHRRIEQWMLALIREGSLVAGDKLPPETGMADALGVSRMTLRQALAALERRQLLKRRRGRNGGTFVVEPKIECDLTGLPGFTEQMRRAHVRAGARVLSTETVPADESVADALRLQPGDPVHYVVRLRLGNDEPLAIERTYLPADVFDGLLDRPLTGSLYELMTTDYDQAPYTAKEALEAVTADAEQAEQLQIDEGASLIRVTRTASTISGLPVEHAIDCFRGDRTRIVLSTGLDTVASAEVTGRATR